MKKALFVGVLLCVALFALGAVTGTLPAFEAGANEAALTLDLRQELPAAPAAETGQIFMFIIPAALDPALGNPPLKNYMASGKAYLAVTVNLGGAGSGSNKFI